MFKNSRTLHKFLKLPTLLKWNETTEFQHTEAISNAFQVANDFA